MHRSRLAGFIIDCKDEAPEKAAAFWGAALGLPPTGVDAGPGYCELDGKRRDLHVEVQRVAHESRVHLDIETDDKEAEVARLERLGARVVNRMPRWIVLEAPTGQRFCVVNPHAPLAGAPGVTEWP
jgi:Glyoxalase-like domain